MARWATGVAVLAVLSGLSALSAMSALAALAALAAHSEAALAAVAARQKGGPGKPVVRHILRQGEKQARELRNGRMSQRGMVWLRQKPR